MDVMSTGEIALRIGAAIGFGALVGLERERKHRPAGFRTMILISLGSAGFMILAVQSILAIPAQLGQELDTSVHSGNGTPVIVGQAEVSRVLQGLLGGIGFLGAGAVIQNKRAVRGLTTAAAVWVTACIGAACGIGLYKLAGVLAFGALFTLVVLEWVEEKYFPEPNFDEERRQRNGKGDAEKGDVEDGGPLSAKE